MIASSSFVHCRAASGGVLSLDSSFVATADSFFLFNVATQDGGVLELSGRAEASFNATLFYSNACVTVQR
jgi:hypothetical protein